MPFYPLPHTCPKCGHSEKEHRKYIREAAQNGFSVWARYAIMELNRDKYYCPEVDLKLADENI